jgi:hypothetical protein
MEGTIKSKTFWTSVVTVGVGVAKALGADVPPGAIEALVGLALVFLRIGVAKSEPK